MQRSTSPQVYLKCDLPNDNIETSSLNRVGTSSDSTLSSNILGCFQMDHEYVHYDLLGDEHFLNLRGKNLSHMKLFLTDRKNRLLTHAVASGPDRTGTLKHLRQTTGPRYRAVGCIKLYLARCLCHIY